MATTSPSPARLSAAPSLEASDPASGDASEAPARVAAPVPAEFAAEVAAHDAAQFDDGAQINVPPTRARSLWKVIVHALRCPACGGTRTRALTGKRVNADGLREQYRSCRACRTRFRAVYE